MNLDLNLERGDNANQGEQFDKLSIGDKFLYSIFESVKQLEELEKVCRDGVEDIAEHLKMHPSQMHLASIKYFRMLLTELGILLRSAKPILDKEKFEKWKEKVNEIKKEADEYPEFYLESWDDERTGKKCFAVTDLFYQVLEQMCEVRGEVGMELAEQGWIFSKPEDKQDDKDY